MLKRLMVGIISPTSNLRARYAVLFCLTATAFIPEPIAQAAQPAMTGKALAEQLGCIECHGENGAAEAPRMAGQDKIYLMRQLQSFSDPESDLRRDTEDYTRYHFGMESNASGLAYDQMDLLATYFSGLECVSANAPDKLAIPEGAKNCTRCHGLFGINLKPGVPDLAGQNAAYLKRQLRAFRAARFGTAPLSQERERYHDSMEENATPLSDEDIEAISTYFAALACS